MPLYDGRNRTFWFLSGETVNGSSQTAILNPTVPIEAWRRGDFSALGIAIRNPLTSETYSDGRIPAARLNPVSLRIQERFYPLPNTGANLFGPVSFNGSYAGHPYADFPFGIPNTAARAFPPVPTIKSRWVYDFFAQDDWKITRNLTLNLGLRYDVHSGWTAQNDLLAIFDISTGRIVVADGGLSQVLPLMPRGYVDIVTASSVGLPARSNTRRVMTRSASIPCRCHSRGRCRSARW